MQLDWQTVVVALAVAAALAYVVRRAWARVRGIRGGAQASAGASCGNCPSGESRPAAAAARPVTLVRIGRARTPRK